MIGRRAIPPLLLLAACSTALAQDIRFFRIGTGPVGGTYFPIAGLIATVISAPPGAPACDAGCGVPGLVAIAKASGGSVDNVRRLAAGQIDAALAQADVAAWALEGSGLFAAEGPRPELRAIATLFTEQIHIVVRAESPIQAVSDLAGHSVSIGPEGSGTRIDADLILSAYDLSEAAIEPVYAGLEPSIDQLLAGSLDAVMFIGGAPVPAIEDLARRLEIRLLPLGGPEAEALREAEPFFTQTVIPEGSYQGIGEVPTLGVGALFLVGAEVDEETVYDVTRALWDESAQRLFAGGHRRGADIRLETALDAVSVPLHPGAERFYREQGMALPEPPSP